MSRLRLQGAPNFRDLGGLPAAGGRRIKPGVLYRSCALDALTDDDVAALGAAGVALVCDLRTAKERDAKPNRLPSPAPEEMVAHPDAEKADPNMDASFEAINGNPSEVVERHVHAIYSSLPAATATTVRELVDRMLSGQLPVVVHCTGGKDRTAWVIAVLQLALGVPQPVIDEDYMLTDRFYGAPELRALLFEWFGREPDPVLVDLFRVRVARLHLAIETAGPFDRYLEREIGLDPQRRARLVELLTEPGYFTACESEVWDVVPQPVDVVMRSRNSWWNGENHISWKSPKHSRPLSSSHR